MISLNINKNFVLLSILSIISVVRSQDGAACNPKMPNCKSAGGAGGGKQCPPFYLIPGKSYECGKMQASKYMSIDSSTVQISPNPVKLPGCFTIQFNVELTSDAGNTADKSFVSKVNFDWVNLKDFSNLPCQNQSADGCNGYGNNCYYCDICNNLKLLKTEQKVNDHDVLKQFQDVECPSKPGIYLLKKEFCFNDFKDLDKNGDCKIDALETPEGQVYKKSLDNLQISGYGEVMGTFRIATNASSDQSAQKAAKEKNISAAADNELASKRADNGWKVSDGQYQTFRNWYVKTRLDQWNKNEYLPWLVFNNEVGCLSVTFTVCDGAPITGPGGKTICPPRQA